jgi:hypothetical protein
MNTRRAARPKVHPQVKADDIIGRGKRKEGDVMKTDVVDCVNNL